MWALCLLWGGNQTQTECCSVRKAKACRRKAAQCGASYVEWPPVFLFPSILWGLA